MIRLGHVADIVFETAEMDAYADANQVPRVVVSVTKRSDGNTLSIVGGEIKKVLAEAQEETGGAASFQILSDDSKNIIASLLKVSQSGLLGILMAVFVIFLFMSDPRATVTIALSIPLSILFTFIGMRVAGVTINLMSLSGIVVALGGMVVDGSIVMLEQVMRLHKEHKMPSEEALRRGGADLVGGSPPILASTTTTLAVFIPLSLLSGIVGSILRDVALTLILALIASLLVALVVVPFILRLVLRVPEKVRKRKPRFSMMLESLEAGYRKGGLAWSLPTENLFWCSPY